MITTAGILSRVPPAPLGGHLWHILLLGSWPPVFGLVVLFERTKARRSRARCRVSIPDPVGLGPPRHAAPSAVHACEPPSVQSQRAGATWCQAMAVASVCAALVHVAVMPDHFAQSIWYGCFFLAAAASQLCFAALVLVRPSRRLVSAGVTGSTLVVLLWLVTRTVGVPIGPDNGATESFGVLDVLASATEVTVAVFGALALGSLVGGSAWRWSRWSVTMRLAASVCLAGTVTASLFASRS